MEESLQLCILRELDRVNVVKRNLISQPEVNMEVNMEVRMEVCHLVYS